ncbi:FAD:protein FMN transferase [Chloroflexota bacterium]
MKKPYKFVSALLVLLIILLIPISCTKEIPEKFEDTRSLMDTHVTVVVYADEKIAGEAINAAFARMEEIEKIATTWDSEGEAFKLNQSGYSAAPSDELLEQLNLSIYYSELTDGSFDITVQPLLDLWEYDPDAKKQFWELDESTQKVAINEAMKLVGTDRIIINDNTIRLKDGTKITLGGIAKGYAVDEALEAIADMGIKYALINAGGDIRTLGTKPDGELWNIALVNPDNTSQSLANFRLSNQAVTTSGNYERYFDPEKKVHHIINPMTGYSAGECISVTIIAKNGAQADALSTGVFVMGPEHGMRLIESLDDVEAFIVDSNREIYHSSGLFNYLSEE